MNSRLLWMSILVLVAGGLCAADGARTPNQVRLSFEDVCLDLESGKTRRVIDARDRLAEDCDLRVGYNSEHTPHAVLLLSPRASLEMAYLDGVRFDSVEERAVEGAKFARRIDRPLSAGSVFLVRTPEGALFRIGEPREDRGGVVLRFEEMP